MNAPDMRSVNGIQLLNLIRETGPVSRASLAKLSGLSKPTVSEQVSRLIGSGVVVETGVGEAGETGGKRPTLLRFHADAARVAGIGVAAAVTRVAISNLEGSGVAETELPTLPEQGARRLSGRIVRALERLMARDGHELSAIGIGVPGRVDSGAGVVLESGSVFNWLNVDLRRPFEAAFGCPVSVDNDVNVGLIAELNHGAARQARTAVLIRAETGIGSAVAIDGRIHHGAHWAAGEIGHLLEIGEAGTKVNARGHLETLLAADQIARRVRAAARRSDVLRKLLRNTGEVSALFAAAHEDKVAREIAADITQHAAVAVTGQALSYDPDVVLLSGELFGNIISEVRALLSRAVPWAPRLEPAAFGEEGVVIGATDMALIQAYEQMSRRLSADTTPAVRAAAGS